MDSERFGRALGKSARAAARGLYEAVDAASAPNPRPAQQPAAPPTAQSAPRASAPPIQPLAVAAHAKRLGNSFLSPLSRAGRALWFEVTGTIFAVFATCFSISAWKLRADARATAVNAADHRHFLVAAATAALFLYFTVSSFLRARHISRARR